MKQVTDQNERVLVLCVSYHNADECLAYAQQVMRLDDSARLHIVVADNAPTPSERLQAWAASAEGVTYLPLGENRGYFGGAAAGLEHYRQSAEVPRWTVVCNTDIDFPDPAFFAKLCDRHANSGAAIVAPSVIATTTGNDQNPYLVRRPSRSKVRFWRWVTSRYLTYSMYLLLSHLKGYARMVGRRMSSRRPERGEPQAIYAPHGAFICFHRSYFEKGGTLRYDGFLFAEELYVAETARRLGLAVHYDPHLVVRHAEHQTTSTSSRLFRKPSIARLLHQGVDYMTRVYFT